MDFLEINIKNFSPTVEEAIANFEIALENAKAQNARVLKVVHGYGSHGVGGAILQELKKLLPQMKRKKMFKNYIHGADWNISNPQTFELVTSVPACAQDVDLNTQNLGITIIVL